MVQNGFHEQLAQPVQVKHLLGHDETAVKSYQRIIELAGEVVDVELLVQAGIALHELGDAAGSSRAYVLALAREPHNSTARTNLGWNLYANGKLDSAVHHFEAVLRKQVSSVAHFNLGLTLLAGGHVGRAERVYRQALATYGSAEGRRIGATQDLEDLINGGVQVTAARHILDAFDLR